MPTSIDMLIYPHFSSWDSSLVHMVCLCSPVTFSFPSGWFDSENPICSFLILIDLLDPTNWIYLTWMNTVQLSKGRNTIISSYRPWRSLFCLTHNDQFGAQPLNWSHGMQQQYVIYYYWLENWDMRSGPRAVPLLLLHFPLKSSIVLGRPREDSARLLTW
jgi:hypothetical protein